MGSGVLTMDLHGNIASWNGTTWSALGTGLSYYYDYALTVYNGELIAGGLFTTAGGVRVLRYGELAACDADGRRLPARLSLVSAGSTMRWLSPAAVSAPKGPLVGRPS